MTDHARAADVPLFAGLRSDALHVLLASTAQRRIATGNWVFRAGEHADTCFVLLGGAVEICDERGRRRRTVAMNEAFGLVGLIDFQPRQWSARALEVSTVLAIGATDLDRLYRADARAYSLLVLNVARELARQLRATG